MGHICINGNSSYYVHDDKTVWSNALMRTRLDPITLETIGQNSQPEPEKEEKAKTQEIMPPKPSIDPAVSSQNKDRFKNLKTSEGDIAKKLLGGEGFNHSSFTRALYDGEAKEVDKKKSKAQYDAILMELLDNDMVKKQGYDYFYKD